MKARKLNTEKPARAASFSAPQKKQCAAAEALLPERGRENQVAALSLTKAPSAQETLRQISKKLPNGAVPPPVHPEEEKRLSLLLGYEILDTGKNPVLDRLTEIAAMIFDAPIALLSLVDGSREWFKSTHGISIQEAPRDLSICGYAILHPEEVMVVPDTLKDPRFATNPFVTGEPFIRFYAGAPLVAGDHLAIGSLCVTDTKPRDPSDSQLRMLMKLSRIAMSLFDSHIDSLKVTRLLHLEKDVYNRLLRSSADLATSAQTFDEALSFLMAHLDVNLGWLSGRIRNMQTGGTTGIYYNSMLPANPQLGLLWQYMDSRANHMVADQASTEFVSSAPLERSYCHLVVPVRLHGTLIALIELIYPDNRKMDPRIQEVFNIMAANLATIAERELINVELHHQATHDFLTGAANRTIIVKSLERAIQETDILAPDSAVLYFDIDGFKDVNDNFGHEVGDRLLQEVAGRLQGICRSHDLLGRLSGDEFVLIARGIDVHQGLHPFLERIQRTLSHSFMLGDLEIKITSSIGCAVISSPEGTTTELLRRAEEAMYLVKNGEKHGFCIADAEVVRSLQMRRNLDCKVKEAFMNERFFLVFQPVLDLQNGTLHGAEVLLRLLEKDGSVLHASHFMQSIERSRFLSQLDERVFAESLRIFSSEPLKTLLSRAGFRFAINITPAILSTNGYAENFLRQIGNAGISPLSVSIEILESHILQSNEMVMMNLTLLREQGVRIALDDFGTGYSNLHQISKFPVDLIKIDKEFISGITGNDPKQNAILSAIIGIARNLGYDILAEGIETKRQADYLRDHGCHYGQGYYFGKPMPMDEFLALAAKLPLSQNKSTKEPQ